MRFYARLILLTFLRFAFLMSLIIFLQRFEVSPLPAWTLYGFGYAMQFAMTFYFVIWALRGVMVDAKRVCIVLIAFLVLGTALEGGTYLWFTGARLRDLIAGYNAASILIAAWYALAIFAAAWHARTKSRFSLAEGLAG